jgi:4-hydroxy-tetrahydrodipicolinate reductase
MILLVLGRGKTGSVVADLAHERGHSVRVIGEEGNRNGSALSPPLLSQIDVVIDFTTPEAAVANIRAVLAAGSRIVVGTTGWYDRLEEMRALCERRGAALLYGSNFSIGVQIMLRLARELAAAAQGYQLSILETHHAGKRDTPSGTALTLQQAVREASPGADAAISSRREGDIAGIHELIARSPGDSITLRHEALSRRGFAEGAVRAAEWLNGRRGCYDFRDIYAQLS